MSFIRLSDDYIDDPKFTDLSDGAFRLWHEGMAYCRRHQTDGVITTKALSGFRYFTKARVQELLTPWEQGRNALWNAVPTIGYAMHDYLEWNPCREEEQKRQRDSKERTRLWRSNGVANSVRDASRDAYEPVRVGLDPPALDLEREEKKDLAVVRFEEFWGAYPRKVGKGAAWNAWRKLQPDQELHGKILTSIAAHLEDSQWQKEGGQFVPHPATFLNQRRFEDELTAPQPHVSEQTSRLAQAVRDFSGSS